MGCIVFKTRFQNGLRVLGVSRMTIEMSHKLTNITSKPFDNKHIKKIMDSYINKVNYNKKGIVKFCDPFANESFTNFLQGCITNDLNKEFNTNYNLEFKDFAAIMNDLNHSFDIIFFDPPYSLRQLKENYDGIGKDLELWQTHNMWKEGKNSLAPLVKIGGYVISFGWTSSGFGKKRGFKKVAVHLFEQAAREDRYDLIMTIEQKVQSTLIPFINSKEPAKPGCLKQGSD